MIESSEKRQCTKCEKVKCLADFRKRYDKPHLFRNECKACTIAYNKQWLKKHPNLAKARNQRRLPYHREHYQNAENRRRLLSFGITPEAYAGLLDLQGGACALCGRPESIKNKSGELRALAIDHDHQTGEVRGLLCFRCNTDLAVLEDKMFVQAARNYLDRSEQ